ncbi:type IX secretion system plug protein domain-containing protein [Psychroserpens sp. Hel_I_66]|uniref:type IX secretion system plug protein n=1 Tax=Psychroserpens sp. Hel_I_66 TaxID=1250004 RepID=UPI0006470D44|nr:type IX secretion system plug protein domain-containing protein [Psychroserpens sp. Hel_I_66]
MIKNFYLSLFAVLISALGFSQTEEINPPDYIKTVTFKSRTSSQGQLPILRLGESFNLEFDVLTTDEPDFYYTIEHYNYDWTRSNLVKMEFMDGFDNYRIVNYQNSFNAYQLYSHYDLQIPNEQTRALTKSGNYIISIYNENQEVVFTRKFMMYKEQVGVGVSIKRSRDVKFIDRKQSVDIVINSGALILNNPKERIKTLIIQNNNLHTSIKNIKPQYTIGKELIYKYVKETAFWASNEFRFFETKDVRGANVGVQFIDLKDIYNSYLFIEGPRANRPYTYNPDINGNFLITAIDTDDVDIEADYTNVHFALQYPELKDGSGIYIYGNFNNYALTNENRLTFDKTENLYQAIVKLKQGFYNYKYVVVDRNGQLDEGRISGNFWQTENNYKVLVYYRDLGARFDELIGYGEANSVNISN